MAAIKSDNDCATPFGLARALRERIGWYLFPCRALHAAIMDDTSELSWNEFRSKLSHGQDRWLSSPPQIVRRTSLIPTISGFALR